jgi:hypothetical protein
MGVDVDRHDVFDVGQLQFGHFRSPPATSLYNAAN